MTSSAYPIQSAPGKPLTPYDDSKQGDHRDFAAAGSYSLYALERMLKSCEDQPNWRLRAKVCAAYYDGKQLTELQRWNLREEDLEERAINLIRPVVNSVLGQEARSRTDVRVEADDDEHADVAEVVSIKLKELERETYAHKAVSDAYGSMVKKGLGWVHVCRNADPLAYPYRVEEVPVDEIWWDWHGQRGTMLDDRCRWLARMRMIDLDEITAALPQHKAVLERSYQGWDERLDLGGVLGQPDDIALNDAWEDERRFANLYRKWDWMDTTRKMVKMVEVWYRVPATVVVMMLSPTKRVLFDQQNTLHQQALAQGAKLVKGVTSQVRQALYAGPHRLIDRATKLRHFPYIPFFAYRDDNDGSPYGLIDGMVAPQDEYNERRHRIQWMLKARQIQMDDDALATAYNSIEDIADNIMRPDLVVITNKDRVNRGQAAVVVKNELAIQKEQFEVMQDSKQLIQDTAGRYSSSLGSNPTGVTSGVANGMLIEQGEQAMGEMNDNYTDSRRRVFEAGVQLILEDHQEADMPVKVGVGKGRRVVVLNTWVPATETAVVQGPDGQPVEQQVPTGEMIPTNMVADAEVRTALADTPSTPAYRQQTQDQVAKIIQALGTNPQAVAVLAPSYIEATSLPDRVEVANDLRRATGQPIPGDKKGREQAEQAQQAALARQSALADKKTVAEIGKLEADARDKEAAAVLKEQQIRSGKALAEAELTNANVDKTVREAANEDALVDGALNDAMKATA